MLSQRLGVAVIPLFSQKDLASALEEVRDGISYANMHNSNFPNGEIRGQVTRSKHEDEQ